MDSQDSMENNQQPQELDKDQKYLILEQYRIYSEAKEKFIDRQFASNRFYLIINLAIFITAFVFHTVPPVNFQAIIGLSIVGFFISTMWWMNIDSYQMLIKIKYAQVLEYLETKLPEQPYHKEFADYLAIKKNSNAIVFGDLQKYLALAILLIHILIMLFMGFELYYIHIGINIAS